MRVIVTAGGTGGHIYPALSIINKIKEEKPNSKFLYIGTTDRMEKDIVPKNGIPYFGIEICGLQKNLKGIKAIFLFIKAIFTCKKKIKEFKPDLVIGVGGYVTAPVIYAAKSLGIKTIVHEQNSIPGKSNKFLEKYTDRIMVSLPGSINYFNKDKVVLTGNPRSEEANDAKKVKKEDIGFDNKKLVLIVMGSLGSMTINRTLKECVTAFNSKDYNVLLVTGNNYYPEYETLDIPKNVHVVPFLDNMINILKSCDLIVSRAGASTIAEITGLGVPSILVPSPYVANNHQFYNAKELEDAGGSIILEEKNFNKETLLATIDQTLENNVLLSQMSENAKKLGIKDSKQRIYKVIEEVCKK